MLKIIKISCFISALFYCFCLSGQDLQTELSREVNSLKTKKNSQINDNVLLKYNNRVLLDSLKKYDTDTVLSVRFNIQLLEYKIASMNNSDTAIKYEVILRHIDYLKDSDLLIRQNAVKNLLTFSYLDFNKKAVTSLNAIIKDSPPSRDLILLIGVANIGEQKGYLLSNIKMTPINQLSDFSTLNWTMHLALARMGHKESINYCINSVENFSNEIIKITMLLSEIGYIRREAAIEYLKKYLNNTKRLPSVKETVEGSQYCQYALDVLANILEDFPIKAQGIGYTDEEIAVARNWMENHKTYNIKR